jgi:hypothetical protein
MWKILGVDALYLEFADVWKERIIEIVSEGKEGKRFAPLIEASEIKHFINSDTGIHTFLVEVPTDISKEDLQFLADKILEVAKTADFDFVSLSGEYQKCQVIFDAQREPEILGLDKAEGYSAGAAFMPILNGWADGGRKNPFS